MTRYSMCSNKFTPLSESPGFRDFITHIKFEQQRSDILTCPWYGFLNLRIPHIPS